MVREVRVCTAPGVTPIRLILCSSGFIRSGGTAEPTGPTLGPGANWFALTSRSRWRTLRSPGLPRRPDPNRLDADNGSV